MADSKGIWLGIVSVVLAIGLVMSVWQGVAKTQGPDLIVTGSAQMEVAPDQAVIFVSVETTAKTSLESQQSNALTSEQVLAALKAIGLDDKSMQTSAYSITPEYYYPQNGPPQLTDYKTTNTLKLTIHDVAKVGQIIDTASSSGANRIDNIQFQLSDSTSERMRQVVLNNAVGNAKLKAIAMVSALSLSLGEVKQISESSYQVVPFVYQLSKDTAAQSATPIQPGTVEVSAQVSVTYNI
ncbi:MAG: SIMPL domain-containing protein [Candidatus Woesearchaeota archaeon]